MLGDINFEKLTLVVSFSDLRLNVGFGTEANRDVSEEFGTSGDATQFDSLLLQLEDQTVPARFYIKIGPRKERGETVTLAEQCIQESTAEGWSLPSPDQKGVPGSRRRYT